MGDQAPKQKAPAAAARLFRSRQKRGAALLKRAERFHTDLQDGVLLVLRSRHSGHMRVYCSDPSMIQHYNAALLEGEAKPLDVVKPEAAPEAEPEVAPAPEPEPQDQDQAQE
jgi:hypothetical protein